MVGVTAPSMPYPAEGSTGINMAIRHDIGRLRWAIHLIAFTSLCLLMIGDALADPVAKALKVSGEVTVTHGGNTQTVAVGSAFDVADVIKTGKGARLKLQFIDGSQMRFAENTTIAVEQFAYDSGNQSRNVLLGLVEGIVNTVATKSSAGSSDYRIHTANVYSAVRGTEWFADAEDAPLRVAVLSGQVEVGATAGQPAQVPAGSYVDATPQGPGPVRPTPAAMLNALLAAVADAAPPATPQPPKERNSKGGGGGGRR